MKKNSLILNENNILKYIKKLLFLKKLIQKILKHSYLICHYLYQRLIF